MFDDLLKRLNTRPIHMTDTDEAINVIKFLSNALRDSYLDYWELLKELEKDKPRVLTLEEARNLKSGSDIWIEDFCHGSCEDGRIICGTLINWSDSKDYMNIHAYSIGYKSADYNLDHYGWRIWTSRPSLEQRKSEQWFPNAEYDDEIEAIKEDLTYPNSMISKYFITNFELNGKYFVETKDTRTIIPVIAAYKGFHAGSDFIYFHRNPDYCLENAASYVRVSSVDELMYPAKDYNKTWRLWFSIPTKDQMDSTAWDS